ncbi:MAG: transcription-repair coupling factor [Syntrophobacterales bacterium]|nr:MAG: transcription-repair coupling factor [Syntrophobacterales bacterium]
MSALRPGFLDQKGEDFPLSTLMQWAKGDSQEVHAVGLKGSSKAFILSLFALESGLPILVITPRPSDAEILVEALRFFTNSEKEILSFPPWETIPYDEIPPHQDIVGQRVRTLSQAALHNGTVIVTSIQGLMQKAMIPHTLEQLTIALNGGDEIDREEFIERLVRGGYTRVQVVEEKGDFSVRGGLIDLFSPSYRDPLRVEFFGDRIESIRAFEPETQRSHRHYEGVSVLPAKEIMDVPDDQSSASLFDYLNPQTILAIDDLFEVEREGEAFWLLISERFDRAISRGKTPPVPDRWYFPLETVKSNWGNLRKLVLGEMDFPELKEMGHEILRFTVESNEDMRADRKSLEKRDTPLSSLVQRLKSWYKRGHDIIIVAHHLSQAERLQELLIEYKLTPQLSAISFSQWWEGRLSRSAPPPPRTGEGDFIILTGDLSTGFRLPSGGLVVITEEEIFGHRKRIAEAHRRSGDSFITSFSELNENDYVVHIDYGIGIYKGLKRLDIQGVSNDYLLLEYLGGDKLYVPVDRINLIQKYMGFEDRGPRQDRLGGSSWRRLKRKITKSIEEMARDLINLYAARQVFEGFAFSKGDGYFKEFEAAFQYEETPDQLGAVRDVIGDMETIKPMDRLICGDVGYGKTEVAIRAAFKAVIDGKQVAVLVPTTVLAQQHYQTFFERFQHYPVTIDILSRFKGRNEQRQILGKLKQGNIDIIIGTHRLLQGDVAFRDLGLLVIDEEHRFGVTHKERLKQLMKTVDALTLTATPIPRTLHMALMGIRDLSVIDTPPEDRLSIRTFLSRFDEDIIRQAILREIQRNGQVFFVHNRVQTIPGMARFLKQLIPEASLAIAHGQMRERDLERVMLAFMRNESNLLLCTSIIESGLDIPTANTIIINHAERFGLAELYQLRGRVGRSKYQAYAFLLVPSEASISGDALKRLRALQELSELGSGFRLAFQDLEIRGAGNILGPAQSGHIAAVGYEMYTQLMERAVRQLRGEEVLEEITPEMKLPFPTFIPDDYICDPHQRLVFYKRLSSVRSEEEIDDMREELVDRFGPIPPPTVNLLEAMKLKQLLSRLRVRKLNLSEERAVIALDDSSEISPQGIIGLVQENSDRFQFTPNFELILSLRKGGWQEAFGETKSTLEKLIHYVKPRGTQPSPLAPGGS